MTLESMHPEDVKAALRKRFGSVAQFERAKDLPSKSVSDVLRGYKSARVTRAISDAIREPLNESDFSGNTPETGTPHRQNAEAK